MFEAFRVVHLDYSSCKQYPSSFYITRVKFSSKILDSYGKTNNKNKILTKEGYLCPSLHSRFVFLDYGNDQQWSDYSMLFGELSADPHQTLHGFRSRSSLSVSFVLTLGSLDQSSCVGQDMSTLKTHIKHN